MIIFVKLFTNHKPSFNSRNYNMFFFLYCYKVFRGDILTDNVIASDWLDRKVVTIMATGCESGEVGIVLCTQKDGSRQEVPCPSACVKYNKFMGGVDRGNQLRGYYQYHLKSRKFYQISCLVFCD